MSETYVECLVPRETSTLGKFGKIVLIMLTVVFGFLALMGYAVAFIIALITAAGTYFVNLYSSIEYEYLYVDKQLSVDKIMAKSKRKKVATYEIERLEILAPIHSYHLDNYKNRTGKVLDYSIKKEEKPDKRYLMFYDGNVKLILSPSEDLVKAIRSVAPRKVFLD